MDHVYAGGGPDKVQAPVDDTGENWLEREDGDDKLWGGPNDDLLFGGSGSDQILCGAGDDYAEGGDDADWIQGNEGVDELYGQGGLDRLCGGAGEVDTIDGGFENPMPTNMCAEDEDSMTNCPYQYDTCAELW
jgi:Ca2+-binding RTX toxin-like protein